MNRGRSYLISVSLTAAGFTLIAPALAQEVGGLTASIGLRQGFEGSDNFDLSDPEESGVRSVTRVDLGLSNVTRNSSLELTASGDLEFGDTDDRGFNDPTVGLSYTIANKNTRLSFDGTYSESDVNALNSSFERDFSNIFGLFSEQLTVGEGTRERTTANLLLETGLDAPLGFTLQTRYNFTDYRDTNDPDLFQVETLSVTGMARFRVNGQLTFNVGATIDTSDALDAERTSRENSRLFANADYQLRPDLRATAELSFSNNETTDVFGTQTEDGFGLGFGLNKSLRNGSIGFDFDSRVTSDGRRDTLTLSRSLELKDGGLTLSAGVVQTDTSDLEPLFNVDYNKNFKRGQLTLGLSQSASTDNDDNTVINSSLRARYNEQINQRSSWGLSAVLADSNSIELNDDTRRLDLGINYRHEVARDWDLVADYTYSTAEQSGEPDRSSNTVSLSLQKTFQFRP